jgi:hypothetical protein
MDKVIICEATDAKGIAAALTDFIAQMEAAYLAQGHAKEDAIFIEINSAEGFLMVGWDQRGGGAGPFGKDHWPVHYLELKHLWRALDSQYDFDRAAHMAIYTVVEEMLIAAEERGVVEPYEFYELFESSTAPQRVLV